MTERKTSRELRSVNFNLRVTKSLIDQLDELRAKRRPIPTRSAIVVGLLQAVLKLPDEKIDEMLEEDVG